MSDPSDSKPVKTQSVKGRITDLLRAKRESAAVPVVQPEEERRKTDDHDAYFNAQFKAKPVYVEPGKVSCTQRKNDMLVATVGSRFMMPS